jgi:hypothetical protein
VRSWGRRVPSHGRWRATECHAPYLIRSIERGTNGKRYARFLECESGWPLAQYERAADPADTARGAREVFEV